MAHIEFALKLEPTGIKHEYVVLVEKRRAGSSEHVGDSGRVFRATALLEGLEQLLAQLTPGRKDFNEKGIEQYGSQLFSELFAELRDTIDMEIDAVRALPPAQPDRYVLFRLDESSSLGLPWELMFRDHPRLPLFLCQHPLVSLVRSSFRPRPYQPPVLQFPLRILVVVSSPCDLAPPNARAEIDSMLQALGQMIAQGRIQMDFVQGPDTLPRIKGMMGSQVYHVVHFIGHAEERDNEVQLILEDRARKSSPMSWRNLWVGLQQFPAPHLVILNVCKGAVRTNALRFGSLADVFLKADIPAVVAHKTAISDEAAGIFAACLYREIADGQPVDKAVSLARQDLPGFEWHTPVLFLQVSTGDIFTVRFNEQPAPANGQDCIDKAQRSKGDRRWAELVSYAQQTLLFKPDDPIAQELYREGILEEKLDTCFHEMQFAASENAWLDVVSWGQAYRETARTSSAPRQAESEIVTYCDQLARLHEAGTCMADPWLKWR